VILLFFIFCYNRLFAVTFDEDFASATGTRASIFNLLISIITGVTVVVAMNLLGALLVSALITFPALSAMRLFKTFRGVILCAAVISFSCAAVGIVISLIAASPIGPTVVAADLAVFAACSAIGAMRRGN
jgi:zinc transport system permease protein